MFDIGWTEILVVVIVGCLVLEQKDIPELIKGFRKFTSKCNEYIAEIKALITDIEQEQQPIKKPKTRTLIDLDGNPQIAYDLEDIKPDIKPDHSKHSNDD